MRTNHLFLIVVFALNSCLSAALSGSSLQLSDAVVSPGDTAVQVNLTLSNSVPYAGIEINISFDNQRLLLRRIEIEPEFAALSGTGHFEYVPGKISIVGFDLSGTNAPADSGVFASIFFNISSSFTHGQTTVIIEDALAVAGDLAIDDLLTTNGIILSGFLCGDADGSSVISISDAVFLINYIFAGGPPPDPIAAGDVDCNGIITISDAVYMINYIFAGGTAPCAACPQGR